MIFCWLPHHAAVKVEFVRGHGLRGSRWMGEAQGGSGKAMSFGKSKAKLLNENSKKVTFDDVAGVEEASAERARRVLVLRPRAAHPRVERGRLRSALVASDEHDERVRDEVVVVVSACEARGCGGQFDARLRQAEEMLPGDAPSSFALAVGGRAGTWARAHYCAWLLFVEHLHEDVQPWD